MLFDSKDRYKLSQASFWHILHASHSNLHHFLQMIVFRPNFCSPIVSQNDLKLPQRRLRHDFREVVRLIFILKAFHTTGLKNRPSGSVRFFWIHIRFEVFTLHPRKLTWNSKMKVDGRWCSFSGWFAGAKCLFSKGWTMMNGYTVGEFQISKRKKNK